MGGLFMGGLGRSMTTNPVSNSLASSVAHEARKAATQSKTQLKHLEHQVGRLSLLNQALWELLRDRLGMTDADLEQLAQEIDMRDGKADGKISTTPVRCPSCGRTCNSKHAQCLYCGQLFEKPLFG